MTFSSSGVRVPGFCSRALAISSLLRGFSEVPSGCPRVCSGVDMLNLVIVLQACILRAFLALSISLCKDRGGSLTGLKVIAMFRGTFNLTL